MKHLRQYTRLWLLVLALVAGSLHVQSVYACSAMGERLQTACCCEEPAESGSYDHLSAGKACCEVSYTSNFEDEAAPSIQLWKADLTPFAPLRSASSFPAAGVHAGRAAPSPNGHHASELYLTTRRLRI
ncbi:hypothetical protein BH24PSE2_BH24PSE2_06730 [soil metagenome]